MDCSYREPFQSSDHSEHSRANHQGGGGWRAAEQGASLIIGRSLAVLEGGWDGSTYLLISG